MGPLDRMFDRDGDGKLDPFERAQQMDFIDYMNHDGIYAGKRDFNDDIFDDDLDSDFDNDSDSDFDDDF